MSLARCRDGLKWEVEFLRLAKLRSLKGFRTLPHRPYDLVINGKKVQCKRVSWLRQQPTVVDVGKHKGHHDYDKGSYDVLALDFRGVIYIIPASAITRSNGKIRGRINVRFFWKYKERWQVFDSAGDHLEESQQALWGGCE